MLQVAKQPLAVDNSDAAKLKRTFVHFAAKPRPLSITTPLRIWVDMGLSWWYTAFSQPCTIAYIRSLVGRRWFCAGLSDRSLRRRPGGGAGLRAPAMADGRGWRPSPAHNHPRRSVYS
jgi:hypothetical protein